MSQSGTPSANRFRFRVFNVKQKQMDDVRRLTISNDLLNNTKDILMQSTGITDRNGKEIYESDIVRISAPNVPSNDSIGEIMWFPAFCEFHIDTGNEVYKINDWSGGDGDDCVVESELEVIGNIHQNPELLI